MWTTAAAAAKHQPARRSRCRCERLPPKVQRVRLYLFAESFQISHGSKQQIGRSGISHDNFFRFALLTSIQGNALISARVVNSKNRDVPSFAGTKEWMDKFASIKKAIPAHCFEHSYFTSFRYLFVDIAVSAALFYAVSFLEQMPFHPAISALLYCPFIAILLLRIFCPAFSLLDAVTPRIGCVRAAFSLDFGCSLTSAATAGSALVTW